MKKPFSVAVFFFMLMITVHAQLTNTKWKGTVNILMEDNSTSPAETTWSFGKDSVSVLIKNSNEPEILKYTLHKNFITMTKLNGDSPCTVGATVKVTFKIKGDELYLQNAESPCDAYAKALIDKPLLRVK